MSACSPQCSARWGYLILIRDAICSSSDAGHDALMQLNHQRYTEQIEVADAATIAVR